MPDLLDGLLSSDYMPHGHCYLWEPALVWLEVITNLCIGVAYLSISVTLAYLVRRVKDIPFQWMYLAFGIFIITCGFTHFMDVWVIWRPNYWLDVAVRAVTAVASVGTAILLFPLVPKAIALASAARVAHDRGLELEELNRELGILYERARETLAEAIPQLVWTATADGELDFVNQRWLDYTGQRAPGWTWTEFVHPDDCEAVVTRWKQCLASGQAYETEQRVRRWDGEYRWFLVRALPLRHDGKTLRWFGTSTDVHDQRMLAAEREQRARADVRARDVFLAVAAHELKTPLTPLRLEIDGLMRAAQSGRLDRLTPDRIGKRLAIVEQQVERLERLVANLLDVARLATGRFELSREEVDVAALLREIVDRHRRELAASGTSISLDVAGPLLARLDRLRIDQVVTNLLMNAARHGRGKPITITLASEGDRIRIEVRDQGTGIAPEDQARIFERFESATSEAHAGGMGLGLWLVRQIVEAHGGSVRVESALGEGAEFTVDLPRG